MQLNSPALPVGFAAKQRQRCEVARGRHCVLERMGMLQFFEPGIFVLACCMLAANAGAEGTRNLHLGVQGKDIVPPLRSSGLLCHYGASANRMSTTSRVRGGGGEESKEVGEAGEKWQRRILVTGGCGFVGSVLVDRLSRNYPEYLVVVLDRLDDCASEKSIADPLSRANCILVKGDVPSPSFLPPPSSSALLALRIYRCRDP